MLLVRKVGSVGIAKIGALSITIILALCLPLMVSAYYVHIFTVVALYAALASAYNLIGGYGEQFSVAHATFVGAGAYSTGLLFQKFAVPPFLGMIFGGFVSAALAVFIGLPCFRLRGLYFSLATLALAEVARNVAISMPKVTGGSQGFSLPISNSMFSLQFETKTPYYYLILGFLIFVILLTYWLMKRTFLGYYVRSLSEEEASNSLGCNTLQVKLVIFSISAFLTAISGGLYLLYFRFFEPHSLMGVGMSINIIVISILGGLGTISGPVMGAIVFVVILESLRGWLGGTYAAEIYPLIFGVLLVLCVIFMPKGISNILELLERKLEEIIRQKRYAQTVMDSLRIGNDKK
jgi:branched-chain amino acid transport system permease protein